MKNKREAIFLVNLVQDINILRPLIYMSVRDFDFQAIILVSTKFFGRDLYGIWKTEIDLIASEVGAQVSVFETDWHAAQELDGLGVIFAASESNLPAHSTTHNIFRYAPSSYLKVTLQHGFECIGFRHSGDHVKAHGESASFGADIVCSWFGFDRLHSLAPSQRAKVLVTGPTAALQQQPKRIESGARATGLVCENLHSVRLNVSGNFKAEFVDAFAEFCELLKNVGQDVVLRPHPGGQYVLKNNVPLATNASLDNAPMYRLDLRGFAYGISAPSSVLIDMLLADVPTAVWRDREGGMDADAYGGLTTVCSPGEWYEFSQEAIANPWPFVELQRRFLEDQGMPLEPADVFARYAEIFAAVRSMQVRPIGGVPEQERILFVANANVPTLQLSFEKPLAPLVARGEIVTTLLTEKMIQSELSHANDPVAQAKWIDRCIEDFDPSIIVFCRYSGLGGMDIVNWARNCSVPILYHIDDDLLAIPEEIGQRKFALHNAPARLDAVRMLLENADLVYASTQKLHDRLLSYYPDLPVRAGHVYCSASVMRRPLRRRARTIGYMASADHAHNLSQPLPALVRLLETNPHVRFQFFGSIPIPAELTRFGDRVISAPPISNYEAFLEEFAKFEWDIGICPLSPIAFNMMKANTKWVEYTAVGAAVVASRGTVYDDCCANGCGILVDTADEWFEALNLLVNDDDARFTQVERAQQKLATEYTITQLREQVLDVIDDCRSRFKSSEPYSYAQKESAIV